MTKKKIFRGLSCGLSVGLLVTLTGCDSPALPEDGPQATVANEAAAADSSGFSSRPAEPRIAPVDPQDPELSAAQQEMLGSRPDYNIYKTLVRHVELYNHWSPLGRVMLNTSTLPARDRELIMLRMGWLCQSEYEWAQHARIASAPDIGMSAEEIRRIAAEPDSSSWTDHERNLLDMVDDLRYRATISNETWEALRERYSEQQVMDALFTAAQYQLVSMALNSLGIQLDPELEFRLPDDLPRPEPAARVADNDLPEPRLPALSLDELSPAQREEVAEHLTEEGELLNLYATMIRHPDLYGPRATFGRYLMSGSGLPARSRELLILRTAWLLDAGYEWGHHVPIAREAGLSEAEIEAVIEGPGAAVWSEEERAVLQAADELRQQAFIRDDTWRMLEQYYDPQRLVEIVFTVGGYTMTGLAINAFGIELEPGYPQLPEMEGEGQTP